MPSIKNAKNPMNNDNVLFTECVNFTLYASISHVIDKQRVFNAKNASISRITHKRTETAFLGVFPSIGYHHTKTLSKRLERAFPAQETPNRQNVYQHDKQAQQTGKTGLHYKNE
jgi:hypothetical protein